MSDDHHHAEARIPSQNDALYYYKRMIALQTAIASIAAKPIPAVEVLSDELEAHVQSHVDGQHYCQVDIIEA